MQPSHGLDCDTAVPRAPGKAQRLLIKFTAEESAKIAHALKTLGFTFSELVDAASIAAAFEQNPVPADKVDTARVNGTSLYVLSTCHPVSLSPHPETRH